MTAFALVSAMLLAPPALAEEPRPEWLERLRMRAGEVDPLDPSCWQDALGDIRLPCPEDPDGQMEAELFLLQQTAFSGDLSVVLVEGAAIALRMPFRPARVWCSSAEALSVYSDASSPWITLTGLAAGHATCFVERERLAASRLPLQQRVSVMVRPFVSASASYLPEAIVAMELRVGSAFEASLPFDPAGGVTSSSEILNAVFEPGTRQLYLDPKSPGDARYTVIAAGERRRVEYRVRVLPRESPASERE